MSTITNVVNIVQTVKVLCKTIQLLDKQIKDIEGSGEFLKLQEQERELICKFKNKLLLTNIWNYK